MLKRAYFSLYPENKISYITTVSSHLRKKNLTKFPISCAGPIQITLTERINLRYTSMWLWGRVMVRNYRQQTYLQWFFFLKLYPPTSTYTECKSMNTRIFTCFTNILPHLLSLLSLLFLPKYLLYYNYPAAKSQCRTPGIGICGPFLGSDPEIEFTNSFNKHLWSMCTPTSLKEL